MKKQKIERHLAQCRGSECEKTCCDDDEVQEWMPEYFAFHDVKPFQSFQNSFLS